MNPQFASLADAFEDRVRAATLSGTTEVTLEYRCVDEEGRDLPPVRTSIVPQTQVAGFGAAGPAFATTLHRDIILGNIDSLVRHAPSGLIRLPFGPFPGLVIRIGTYDMLKVHEVVVGDLGYDVTCICVLEGGESYTEAQIRAFGFEESAGYP